MMYNMVLQYIMVLCLINSIKAQTQDKICPNHKLARAVDSFLDVLNEEDPEGTDLRAEVERLTGVVDKLEDLISTLAEQQEQQSQQLLNRISEVDGKVDETKKCTCSLYYDLVFHVSVGGTYKLNFAQAKLACIDQGAVIATLAQLQGAHAYGLDFCAAGWLEDGSVRYPITMPRNGCGGKDTAPGIRSYGSPAQDKTYDVYCFGN